MKPKRNLFKQIIILFNSLRFFYDKSHEKGIINDYKTSSQYLEKLKHFHGMGIHFYYVADLRKLKIVEVGGSVLKMTGISQAKIEGRNFAFGLRFFALNELVDILRSLIDYHQYVYNKPIHQRLSIKGSIMLKVKNGKGGYFNGLLQAAPLALDSKGHIAVMFSSITDISHFNLNEDYVKVDIIDESDYEEIKVINVVNKKNDIVLELSKSELKILGFLKTGNNTKEIADMLSLSEHTVNTHRRNMIQKMNVKNTAELISRTIHLP
jgi:DNA-binding CsgD family transcriptional regulator